MLCIRHPKAVQESKYEFLIIFACDDVVEFKEYVGCKIQRNIKEMKFTHTSVDTEFKRLI